MNSSGIIVFLSFLFLTAVGCATTSIPGTGLLPEGMDSALIPDVENSGFIYVAADPPLTLSSDAFARIPPEVAKSGGELPEMTLGSATLVIGDTPDEFGGVIEFESQAGADLAWALLSENVDTDQLWGRLASPRLLLANGTSPWAERAREALDSEQLTSLRTHDPEAWSLVTNLPAAPPSPPVAAGTLALETDIIEPLSMRTGISLEDLAEAFELVRVERVGFGIYSDSPLHVSADLDREYLKETRSSIVFVSQSSYHGGFVAFMLSVVAGRSEMELLQLDGTNARYRMFEDLHVIIANKGSILYAVAAWTLEDARDLLSSALN